MESTDHPESNIELVRAAYTAFWNDEFDAFFGLFEDDFEWVVSDGFPYGGRYRGRDEVMASVFSQIRSDWESFTHELDRLIDGGDTTVAIGQYEGTHGTTGERVTVPMAHVFDIEAGKIQRFQQFTDTASFQAALPASERTMCEWPPHYLNPCSTTAAADALRIQHGFWTRSADDTDWCSCVSVCRRDGTATHGTN